MSPMALSMVKSTPTPPAMTYDLGAPVGNVQQDTPQKVEQKQRLRDWLRKLRRDEQNKNTTLSKDGQNPESPTATPARPGLVQKVSRKVGVGIPRSTTFKRQEDEQRKNLEPVRQSPKEKRELSRVRSRALSVQPRLSSEKVARRETSAPDLGYHGDVYPSIDTRIQTQDFAPTKKLSLIGSNHSERPEGFPLASPAPPPPPPQQNADVDDGASMASYSTANTLDDEITLELERKWILNLSMHFRDRSPREKFFITYAEEPRKWRRVTVSCDYRNAEPESLEADLSEMKSQREKSARIYESLRASLGDISFFDTVTNLKLETREERLHVHVTEDVNEIIPYPPVRAISHIPDTQVRRYKQSELHFVEHMSGFVYKVDVAGETWIKKEIPGPDSIDEFLYEISALSSLTNADSVIKLQGFVVNDDETAVKGLLIAYAEKNALVDVIYDNRDNLPWLRRERWARQIVNGLSEIHEAGFVQGDFTLSNIVIDGNDDAKIIDINRRGCPVGWEPPEIASLIDSGQRIAMFIGVKSDLFQLGMVLWGLAMEEDEPEHQQRPLTLADTSSDVPSYFRNIIATCLSDDPKHRLSAKDLLKEFPASVVLDAESAQAGLPVLQPAPITSANAIVTGSTSRAEVDYPKRISTPDCDGSDSAEPSTLERQPASTAPTTSSTSAPEYTQMLSWTAQSSERRYSKSHRPSGNRLAWPGHSNGEAHSSIDAQHSSNQADEHLPSQSSKTAPWQHEQRDQFIQDLSALTTIPSRGRLTEAEAGQAEAGQAEAGQAEAGQAGIEPSAPVSEEKSRSEPVTPGIPINPDHQPGWEEITEDPYLIHPSTLDPVTPVADTNRHISWAGSAIDPAIPPHRSFEHVDSGLGGLDFEPPPAEAVDSTPNAASRRQQLKRHSKLDEGDLTRQFQHVDSGIADMHLAGIGGNENLSFSERAQRGDLGMRQTSAVQDALNEEGKV